MKKRTVVSDTKIYVINYLDKPSAVEDKIPDQLLDKFSNVDEFSLRLWHKEMGG